MKNMTLAIALIISRSLLLQAGQKDSVNITDAEGKKQGYWIVVNNMKKPPLENFKNDAKVEEGKYVNDMKNGIWRTYFPNGNKSSEVTYVNNTMNGYAKTFYESGEIMEEGDWKSNKWAGNYTMKYPDGKIQHKFAFNVAGKTEGSQEYYNPDGILIMKGEKKNGKETGKWAYYDDKGNLEKEVTFNDGVPGETKIINTKPVNIPDALPVQVAPPPVVVKEADKPNMGGDWDGNGYQKLYNRNRQISKDGDFERFKLKNGKEYHYDENGILQRIAVWKKFKYVGEAPLPDEK